MASSQFGPEFESGPESQAAAAVEAMNPGTEEMTTPANRVVESAAAVAVPEAEDTGAWRDELSARLSQYRARRKARPPRYPSLRLPFETRALPPLITSPGGTGQHSQFEPVSNHALALDGMRQVPSLAEESNVETEAESRHATVEASPHGAQESAPRPSGNSGAKIIAFPGLAWGRDAWGPPVPPADQLAEPVSERPRILDVPEIAPPPPALGGITIDAARRPEAEKRPGIDIPLQSASLSLRLLAAVVDGVIVAAAAALFGLIFWKVAAVRPPLFQFLGLAAGVLGLFWAAFQYLLIVYAGNTPGLRAAGLELARFDGSAASRTLRRWRVLASYLSAASVGMGYAWLFLDEDALCWHDRITHTYLAPKQRAASSPAALAG